MLLKLPSFKIRSQTDFHCGGKFYEKCVLSLCPEKGEVSTGWRASKR